MTPTEKDVLAVRQLAHEPSAESVTRTWYRMTQLEAKQHKVSRRRFLIPATAGLAIAAVTIGGIAFFGADGPRGGNYLAGAPVETVAALEALALAAESSPSATLADGQRIYVEIDGWGAGFSAIDQQPMVGQMKAQARDITVDPDGMQPLSIVADGVNMNLGAPVPPQPPSVHFPDPAWLAALPTDPVALLAFLRQSTEPNETWSVDHQLWDAMAHLYSICEIILSPATRAALLRSYAGIGGLTAREIVLDGRSLVAVRFGEGTSGQEILFDPGTGQAVGRSSIWLGGNEVTVVQPPSGPVAEPGVLYVATWAQSIVS